MVDFDSAVSFLSGVKVLVERWEEDPEPLEWWGDRQVPAISEEVFQQFLRLDEWRDTDEVKECAWHVVLLVDNFCERFQEWQQQVREHDGDPGGNPLMWNAWRALVNGLVRQEVRKIESIRELVRQGVGANQIAKMYGWRNADGSPDVAKAHYAISHPDEYPDQLNPEDQKAIEETAKRWEGRTTARAQQAEEEAKATAEPPESLEQIVVLPGMTSATAIKIGNGHWTKEDVYDAARRMGVTLNEQEFLTSQQPASAADKIRQQEEEERKARAEAEAMEQARKEDNPDEDLAIRVRAMAENLNLEQIVELLAQQGIERTQAEVADLIELANEPADKPAPKRGRGRPKGAKNKAKEPAEAK